MKIKSAGRDFNKFIRVETYAEDIKSLNFIDLSKPEVYEVYQNNILKNGYTHEFKKIQTEERQRWQDFYNQKIADLVFSKLEDQFNFFDYNRNKVNKLPNIKRIENGN